MGLALRFRFAFHSDQDRKHFSEPRFYAQWLKRLSSRLFQVTTLKWASLKLFGFGLFLQIAAQEVSIPRKVHRVNVHRPFLKLELTEIRIRL